MQASLLDATPWIMHLAIWLRHQGQKGAPCAEHVSVAHGMLCARRTQVDTGAALEQNEAAQQQQQQQQQDKEQVTQQAPSARGDGDNTRNALGIPSKQIVKRAPSLMDCVRVREPGSRNKVDSVVLGSADGGARLKVRQRRTVVQLAHR